MKILEKIFTFIFKASYFIGNLAFHIFGFFFGLVFFLYALVFFFSIIPATILQIINSFHHITEKDIHNIMYGVDIEFALVFITVIHYLWKNKKMLPEETKNQKNLRLKVGDIAYTVELSEYYCPTIKEIYITGECNNFGSDQGYVGNCAGTKHKTYEETDDKLDFKLDKNGNEIYNNEIHTCIMLLFKTKNEAIEFGRKLVNEKIKILKKKQAEIQKSIEGYTYWKKKTHILKKVDRNEPSKVLE